MPDTGGRGRAAPDLTSMRTYVRMTARPWNPRLELDGALDRGDLRYAMTLADELRIEYGDPIDLATALRFLPLIARESPREFDAWALRWLSRWAGRDAGRDDRLGGGGCCAARMPSEPAAFEALRKASSPA
jgi:hypothetical protein